MAGKAIEINADQFEAEVLNQELAVVDFYSDECPPCAALAPKYEALSELYGHKFKFVKIFRQKNRELAEEYGVQGSPSVLFFKNGKRIGDFLAGGIKRSEIQRNLDAELSIDEADAIHQKIETKETECEILILGGGPAGLTAGIYSAQAKRHTIIVDPQLNGGQVSTTHMVSNYPGFVEPVNGFMLAHFMSEQAAAAGAEFRQAVEINKVDLQNKTVLIDGIETIRAKKIILSMGSSPRLLGIPGEVDYRGQGISYCATCDGKYYGDKEIVVVGGGNSAVEEALFLTKFAKKITIVHQFEHLQANKTAVEQALNHPKIEFLFKHEPREFIKAKDAMEVVVEDLSDNKIKRLKTDGVFIFIGMKPNLDSMNAKLELDEWGYVQTDQLQKTSLEDVFAVGDIASKPFRQITIATAEGTVASIQAVKELELLDHQS